MKDKVLGTFAEAVADIKDGSSVMFMSFVGPGGIPQNLIAALRDLGAKELSVIACCNFGWRLLDDNPRLANYVTPHVLVQNGQVRRAMVTTDAGDTGNLAESNVPGPFEQAVRSGTIERELAPLGVFAHRLRAGGSGVGAFYSPVGVDTPYERGKEKRIIDGRAHILEYPLRAQFGFVRAQKADKLGNLVYDYTARCLNPLIAKACDLTIAEVEEIVEPGAIDPNQVVTAGIFVDRIVQIPEGGWK